MQEAQQQAAAEEQEDNKENEEDEDADADDAIERKKRKRKEEKALNKIKQTKEFKKRKFEEQRDLGSDADDDDTIARQMMTKNKPLPGQLENCELCEKRFTVTPYSKTGPDGGLLCGKCSKELKDEEKKMQKATKKKAPQARGRKRQTESDRMMGDVKPGAKSLVDVCVRKVADVVNDVEDFGDMPEPLLDRMSQILSKKRVLTPRTFNLFLRDDVDHVNVYDCGKLETEDFERLFAHMPHLVSVNLRCAGQMKDDGLRLMIDKCNNIRHIQLGALNLISEDVWIELFHHRGAQIETLKLSELQGEFTDKAALELTQHCTNLKRLKLRGCSHLTETAVQAFSNLSKLEHLTLAIAQVDTTADTLIDLINKLGPNLKTLCLEGFDNDDDSTDDDPEGETNGEGEATTEKPNAHDEVLLAIRDNCTQLRKLRITGNSHCTDRMFAELFSTWKNKSLVHADFSECRWIDNNDPAGPQDYPVGFAYDAFEALMQHSGTTLERLDLHSCRHISHAALTEVFDGKKRYPQMRSIDLSFVSYVDEEVLAGIFRSCPQLSKLVVFACFNARGAEIPPGVAVIGLPNAQDSIVIQGFMDDTLTKAMA